MAYAAWSVIFGEQPSAAKWNVLGSNDASFNDGTGIANLALNTTAISNPYKFSVQRTTAQTPNGTAVLYNNELFDTNNNYDTATGKYTAPVAGFYQINAILTVTVTASPQDPDIRLVKNGTTALAYSHVVSTYSGTSNVGLGIATLVQLAATDYLQVISSGPYALDVTLAGYNTFSGFLVSIT